MVQPFTNQKQFQFTADVRISSLTAINSRVGCPLFVQCLHAYWLLVRR